MNLIWLPKFLLALATGVFSPVLLSRLLKGSKTQGLIIFLFGLAASISLCFFDTPSLSILLVLPWAGLSFLVAFIGVRRLLIWNLDHWGFLLVSMGCIYLAVGGVWLVASTLPQEFLGFQEPWKTLTAVHFHFASFIFPVTTGLLIASIQKPVSLSAVLKTAIILFITSVVLVALGINGLPTVEMIGATLLSLSGITILCFLLLNQKNLQHTNMALAAGLICGIGGLSLSLLYGLRIGPVLNLDLMAKTHGIINSLLLTPVLVYFAVRNFPTHSLDRPIPFSKLHGAGVIGPGYFDNMKTSPENFPSGLVDRFDDFERNGFNADAIPHEVRDFYENTNSYLLKVEAQAAVWFGLLWKFILRRFFRHCGQLDLPENPKNIQGKIISIQESLDGRSHPRGWIRTDTTTGEAVYVAAYSTHTRTNITYMNIAFPLPFCNLTSILFLGHLEELNGIKLTTLRADNPGGDQGVYLVRNIFKLRLPLNEMISVWWDGTVRAKHEMWFWGMKYLTLNYTLDKTTD